jgi:prepilin-type N-terminal cleavage/methylation domain-containing protein
MTNVFAQLPVTARKTSRGFTLTELAIVLGIIGIILGAIWSAASMVYENNRTKQASNEVLTIIGNWKSIYGAKRVDVAYDWFDITALTINNNFMPQEMIVPGVTTQGNGPWTGSWVNVYGIASWNAIAVWYNGLSQSACNHLANAVLTGASTQLVMGQINNDQRPFPAVGGTSSNFASSDASNDCVAGNANQVGVVYAM